MPITRASSSASDALLRCGGARRHRVAKTAANDRFRIAREHFHLGCLVGARETEVETLFAQFEAEDRYVGQPVRQGWVDVYPTVAPIRLPPEHCLHEVE